MSFVCHDKGCVRFPRHTAGQCAEECWACPDGGHKENTSWVLTILCDPVHAHNGRFMQVCRVYTLVGRAYIVIHLQLLKRCN